VAANPVSLYDAYYNVTIKLQENAEKITPFMSSEQKKA
jgi:hypothetical protein